MHCSLVLVCQAEWCSVPSPRFRFSGCIVFSSLVLVFQAEWCNALQPYRTSLLHRLAVLTRSGEFKFYPAELTEVGFYDI